MSLRKLALVTLVVAVILVIPATGGFSSVSADRGMKVSIAPDGSAYLGFEQETSNINENTSSADLNVTIINRLGSGLTVTVDSGSGGEHTKSLGPGESEEYTFFDVQCGSTIYVEASGSGVTVEFERKVPDC